MFRIKLVVPAFVFALTVTALLSGCAVYPEGGPAYGGGYSGGYGSAYGGGYDGAGGPVAVQPSVAIGIDASSGPGYYGERDGYDRGYRGQPQSRWNDRSPHANGGPHNPPPPQHGGTANPSFAGGPGAHPGNAPQQPGRNSGQRESGGGNAHSADNGRGSNH